MKIVIETPQTLESTRTQLLDEAVELLKKYERSCSRYAMKMACIRNKIRSIEKKLGEH